MKLQYLTDLYTTIDALKKAYKKLAFKLHPDVGGSTEAMQILNNEYEYCILHLGEQTNRNYTLDKEYVDIIDALIKMHMDNVYIEIRGWFVCIGGDTKPYAKELKALKLYWHTVDKEWYYKPSWYVKKTKKVLDVEKKRNLFGSEFVTNSNQYKAKEEKENKNNDYKKKPVLA